MAEVELLYETLEAISLEDDFLDATDIEQSNTSLTKFNTQFPLNQMSGDTKHPFSETSLLTQSQFQNCSGDTGNHEGDLKPKPGITKSALPVPDLQRKKSLLKVPKFYLPKDVSEHNKPNDCWISIHGWVYDLTPLIKFYEEDQRFTRALTPFAGMDLSSWFDEKTEDVKFCIHPKTGLSVPFVPTEPDTKMGWKKTQPWWKANTYKIGKLTKEAIDITIFNEVTQESTKIRVCAEDTLQHVQERFEHVSSEDLSKYRWLYEDDELDGEKTFGEIQETTDDNITIQMCLNSSNVDNSETDCNASTSTL